MEFSELIRTRRAQAELLQGAEAHPQRGTLCVTGHHLLLSPGPQASPDLWLLPLRSVDCIEKRVAGDSITLSCKDLRVLQVDIEGMGATLDIARSIEALSSLESVITSYPFFYRPKDLSLGDAWLFHPPECYYKRVARETNAWRLSEVNEDFSLCPSYPRAVIVPRMVDDDALACSACFRQGGRFPVLSYYHTLSRTASPTPPQILSLAPTASLLGPFLHWAGQFGARLLPWLLPFLAAPCPASNRPSPLSLILPLPTLAPPLSRVSDSRLSSRDPGGSGRLELSLFVNSGPAHGLLIGSLLLLPKATQIRVRVPPIKALLPRSTPASSDSLQCVAPVLSGVLESGLVGTASGAESLLPGAVTFQPAPDWAHKRRCAKDEELLRAVLAAAPHGAGGFIVDTRSARTSKQARITGSGTEAKVAYPSWKRLHRPLESKESSHPLLGFLLRDSS